MNNKAIIAAAVATVLSVNAQESELTVNPILGLQTRIQKDLFDNGKTDNMDDFFGRINVGMNAEKGPFSANFLVQAYPTGFGYELLRGIQTVEDSMEISTEQIAKFQIPFASFTYFWDKLALEMGRSLFFDGNGMFYGNYTDEGPGGYFTGKGVFGNFVKLKMNLPVTSASLAFGTESDKMNTGYIRYFQDVTLLDEALHFGVGVRSDFLNRVHDGKSVIHSNVAFVLDYTIKERVKLFLEPGITDITEETDPLIPILYGVQIALPKVVDNICIEAEYLNQDDREYITYGESTKQVSSILWGFSADKAINDHFKVLAGLKNEREAGDVRLGVDLQFNM